MVSLSVAEFSLITAIMLIGSASQAAIGMGLNLFAIPLLLLIHPSFAPGPVLVASLALSFLALWRVPARIVKSELGYAVAGLVVGTVLAGAVAMAIDASSLARVLGLFVVLGVGLALSGWSVRLVPRNLVLAGSGAGFLGTIAGVHAPPIALLYQGMEPSRVRGAILVFVGLGNALSVIALALVGHFGKEQVFATLYLVPGVLAGLVAAPTLAKMIDAQTLRVLVLGISGLSGLLLVLG